MEWQMLGLLHTILRKREMDPATNLVATKRLIGALPLQDEYEAHHMIVKVLNLFNSSTEPLNRERLQILFRLDESCQGLQDGLSRQYLKNTRSLKHAEKVLWKEIFALNWHLAHAYQAFLRQLVTHRGESEFSNDLPVIATRAMHYFGTEVKWRYFHQEEMESNMWRRLHKIYLIAESENFAGERITLADGSMTTCGDEYLQILLLDLLTPTSLKSVEIEVLDHMLNKWSAQIALDRVADAAYHTHRIDFSAGAGASRLIGAGEGGDKVRYFSIKGVLESLNKVVDGLRAGELPEKHDLPFDCRLLKCVDLLEQVTILWSRGTALRILPRDKYRRPVEVASGFEALKLKLMPGAEMIDEISGNPEYWALVNESERGVGLKIDSPTSESPSVGNLVGIRDLGGNDRWEIGVVRWLTATDDGRMAAGVEKLSFSPRLVELKSVENPLIEPGLEANAAPSAEALFLPRVDEHGMASSLIFPSHLFSAGRLLDLYDSSVIYRVRLSSVVEQNTEWTMAKFDILGRRQI
jgi:hypothetical protein